MENENILEDLKAQIEVELELCNDKDTPTVCFNYSDPDTRAALIDTIVETCMSMKLTIAQAIVEVEKLYSTNSLD